MNTSQKTTIFLFIFLASAALHGAMFATGYMQEDALITFRTAFNLADYGIYSFNLDERHPGATSLFYGFFVAAARLIFADYAIPIIKLTNIFFVLIAGYFLYLSIRKSWILSQLRQDTSLALVLLAATASPALLKISSSGMETAILFLVFCLSLLALAREKLIILCICLASLPFIRIDSAGFCCIVIACLFFVSKRKALFSTIAFITGFGLLLLSNIAVFDALLPLTAEGKAIAYSPDKSIGAITGRYLNLMFSNSFLLGVHSRYIHTLGYISAAIVFLVPVFIATHHFSKNNFFAYSPYKTTKRDPAEKKTAATHDLPIYVIAFASILVPLAYAAGGVIFPWYLWPYSSLAFVLLIAFLVSKFKDRTIELICLIFISGLATLTLFINISISEQENRYRASIGRHIKEIARPADTLFLEPAGYIPFFAEIKTFDTIGLASPQILRYHKNYRESWWINFVVNETPSFIVDRFPIHATRRSGDGGYFLSDDEYDWFMNNYALEASFNYNEYLEKNKTYLFAIYKLGDMSEYFLYRRRANSKP